MTQLMRPFFGDLIVNGTAVLGLSFVLALVWDALWQKRRSQLVREWPKRKFFHPTNSNSPTRNVFKKFRGKFLSLAIVSIAIVMLLLIRGKSNTDDVNGLTDYSTNFQGDATCPAPATKTSNLDAGGTDSFESQHSTHIGHILLMEMNSHSTMQQATLTTSNGSNVLAVPFRRRTQQ